MSTTTTTRQLWPQLDALKFAFDGIQELPYCSGTVALDPTTSKLFYQAGDKVDVIDFVNAKDAELAALASACQPASFGLNREDVIDDSYRNAGKMDIENFATQFSLDKSGVIDLVRSSLIQGHNSDKNLKAALYKLNVYGPGSFFKAHVDTPRSDTMFGSLVIVLPTAHEGGSLIFRHKGQESAFDTAAAVRSAIPQIAFVAFYSDVEHEVAIVDSSYRVTLTYNLYLVDVPSAHPLGIVPTKDPLNDVKSALSPLLVDPKFLPTGGLLGFQLAHKYPFKIGSTDFEDLKKRLKGSDAAIDRICQDMSLMTSLKALHVYTPEYQGPTSALVDTFLELENYQYEGDELMELFKEHGATFVYSFPEKIRGGEDDSDDESDDESDGPGFVPIFWIKQGNACNSVEQPYMAYGNQAELDHIYVELCLVAEIKPFTERNSTMAI